MGWRSFVRAVAPVVAVTVAVVAPEILPAIGTAVGASGATATAVGAGVVAGGTTLLAGGTPKQAAKSAVAAGIGSEIAQAVDPAIVETVGVSPETSKAIATGAGVTGGEVATGSNLKEAAKKGVIAGGVQALYGTPSSDASGTEKLSTAYAKQYTTQAINAATTPQKTRTPQSADTSSATYTAVNTTPSSSALGQALRIGDAGAPIFGASDKENEGKKSGWNVESLRYMNSSEA